MKKQLSQQSAAVVGEKRGAELEAGFSLLLAFSWGIWGEGETSILFGLVRGDEKLK